MLLDEILILGADAIVEGPDVIVEGPDVERPVSILFPAATGAKTGALEEEETGRGGLKGFMI